MNSLQAQTLTAEAFSPYGEVIETKGTVPYEINYGMADRYHALAKVETLAASASQRSYPVISIVKSKKYGLPQRVKVVERHPLGSQAFIPTGKTPFVVVVAEPCENVRAEQLRAFITNGNQGINYHAGVWHGLLLTPFAEMTFICVDREGTGENCEEYHFSENDQYRLEIPSTL